MITDHWQIDPGVEPALSVPGPTVSPAPLHINPPTHNTADTFPPTSPATPTNASPVRDSSTKLSFQALEEAFERPTLAISTLRKFRKEHLKNLCEAKSIKISHNGKSVLKEQFVQALFSTVSGYKVSDTRLKNPLEASRVSARQ
jgi:hypothetical protein